ncbi:hypothetical protein KIH86_22005 [Paenibacillus sp. HN-1]|uniref:hypothetical protein n=1 Tax=Paenibacillus TaxID=44249 RepID=UPI001CA973F8|nr:MULTISPECIES: hypothetical protein [Paenibacillus]MBY9079091.1 hypothetical protein [Paenibacillus sp. CGMCC 1.18879]MBY9086869.1 hypothetical protein [Paenibacillus sinensis]
MKKLTLLLLTFVLAIALAPAASAATQDTANLHITNLSVAYSDTGFVYRTVLHNTGNMTLNGISSLHMDFYDRNGNRFESVSYPIDADLKKLVLKPGESKMWQFTVKTKRLADIGEYKYNAVVGSAKPVITSGTVVKINNRNGAVSAKPVVSGGMMYISLKDMASITGSSLRTNTKAGTVTLTYKGIARTLKLGTAAKLINGNMMIGVDYIKNLYPEVGVALNKMDKATVISIHIS